MKANAYREAGNTKTANRYDNERYRWEKLLSDLELLNEIKIKELLDYKKGYFDLQQENQELKKQYCERTDCSGRLGNSKKIDQLEKELEQLKGIFAQVNDDTLLRDCGNMNAEINELKNQQKEFIKYMNDISEDLETEDVDDEEMKGYLIQRIDTFKEILSKYKEIIGGKE